MTTQATRPTPTALRYLRSEHREIAPTPTRIAAIFGTVALLHLAGFGLVGLSHLTAAATVLPLGAALTAYGLGLRHALDADHIAGIDNATRKFVGEGRRPMSVGLAFSLGHSTVVFAMVVLVALGVGFATNLLTEDSTATSILGVVGASVAAAFLLAIAVVNGAALRRMITARRQGATDDAPMSSSMTLSSRIMQAPLRRVQHPRHIYALGVAFGLGFDTASSIGMIALAATVALSGASTWLVLCLPLCFAAGMTLVDATDGIVMVKLYGSAQIADRDRQLFNIAATALSVAAAAGIGTVIAVSTLHEVFSLADPMTTWIAGLDLEHVGWILAGTFVTLWGCAAAALWARRDSSPSIQ